MRCDPAICSINDAPHSGQLRQKPKGSSPPNLLGEKYYGVRAADILAVPGENAHFLKRRAGVKAESFLDPRCLERQKMKAAAGEQSLELFGCRDTVSALAIIKNPASEDWLVRPRSGGLQPAGAIWRSPFLEFSHFCRIRMNRGKIFHRLESPSIFKALSPSLASLRMAGVGSASIWA